MDKYRLYNRRKNDNVSKQNEKNGEITGDIKTYNRMNSTPIVTSQKDIDKKNIFKDNNNEKNETKKIPKDEKQLNKKTEENHVNSIENNISKKNKNEYEDMDNIFNEVERFNAKNILKGDLAEIYNEVIKDNSDFKENIFFVNLNYYENMIGNCDDTKISHSFKEYKKEELFKNNYLPAKELYNKYNNKAKIIKEKKDF